MFVVGVLATLLWQEVFPPNVTLCQLAQNPRWYRYRKVRVEADARSIYGAVFTADESCQSLDGAAGVWRDVGYVPQAEVQKLYNESDKEIYKARILVEGRFDPNATPGFFAPKFAIRATHVQLKSEIVSEPMKRLRQ